MSFLTRIWNLIRGKTDAILDKMENPAEQLSVVVADLNKQLKIQHQAVAKAMADEQKLKLELEDMINQSQEWEKKAVYALQVNDEELAKQALLRKEEIKTRAMELEKHWVQQKTATDSLRKSFQGAKDRAEEVKRQYTLMVAQYQSAVSKQQIVQTTSSLNENSTGAAIAKLKDKIQLLEAETAAEKLLTSGDSSIELEQKFKALETNMKADQALAELKGRMSLKGGVNSSDANSLRDVTPVSSKKVSGH